MYYVYGHKEKGKDEYAYIGHGSKKRAYRNTALDLYIISTHSTKEEAFLYEKHNIKMHKPKFNIGTYYGRVSNKKTDELTPLEVSLRKKERIAHYRELKNT